MAGVDVSLYAKAAVITTLLLLSIYSLNLYLSQKREDAVSEKMNEIIKEFEEVESTYYLMDYLSADQNHTCNTVIAVLNHLESQLWKLDSRIKSYKDMTKQIESDEFYINEKEKLNRRELIHLTMLEKIRKQCNYNQTIVLYFYGNCEKNLKCDEQGFVLSYINNKIDPELAVFSFDADRDVYTIKALMDTYNVTELPCVVIEGHPHCGLHNKDEVEGFLCDYSPRLSICNNTKT
ncbi:MAG: hypothetical protein PHG85_06970 [Candidatus Altiarchaeota archaeon]|nr:hypothetical protein [Candidatus Altiarchaeota archaeon]